MPTDKYNNPALDEMQLFLYSKLDFREDHLYAPKLGDCICTFDIGYNDQTAIVACDISWFGTADFKNRVFERKREGEYIPGYFSFYEGPYIVEALEELGKENIHAGLVIADGHGLAHPRKFGLACYLGVKTGLPAIGVGKRPLLKYDESLLGPERGNITNIKLDDEIVGCALRTQTGIKPIFVSAGNKISLQTSIDLILELSPNYRIPEPLRRADHFSKHPLDHK